MIRFATLVSALAFAGAASADDLRLAFPVDCVLGDTCFIQNYVDRDPSAAMQDFSCGHLTYDTHTGTDIALPDLVAMEENIAVRAVAAGTVRATRDGMADISIKDPNAPDVTNKSCGNAVVVDHGNGWEARYCHLKRGSVAVRSGDVVDTTTQLGAIGLSGRTEFPHLHLSLKHNGENVDPFQPHPVDNCGTKGDTLWIDDIAYTSAGFISAGAASFVPSFDKIKAGTAHYEKLPDTAPGLVFWAHFFGPRAGDQIEFQINSEYGVFLNKTIDLDRDQARAFRATGRKLTTSSWPPGIYSADISLIRNGKVVDKVTTKTILD